MRLEVWMLLKQTRTAHQNESHPIPICAFGRPCWRAPVSSSESTWSSEFTVQFPDGTRHRWSASCTRPSYTRLGTRLLLFPKLRSTLSEWSCATTGDRHRKVLQFNQHWGEEKLPNPTPQGHQWRNSNCSRGGHSCNKCWFATSSCLHVPDTTLS